MTVGMNGGHERIFPVFRRHLLRFSCRKYLQAFAQGCNNANKNSGLTVGTKSALSACVAVPM
jgi:hypothetical protein